MENVIMFFLGRRELAGGDVCRDEIEHDPVCIPVARYRVFSPLKPHLANRGKANFIRTVL